MKISDELVDYVAALSRLKLTNEARSRAGKDLAEIIDYMDILKTVDTENEEALSHVFPIKNVLRQDEVLPSFERQALLRCAPHSDEEAVIVPKTVE